MEYITTTQAAKKWDITANRISILASQGRITGAVRVGGRWMIPEDAQKPRDNRKRKGYIPDAVPGEKNDAAFFRYPSFAHRDPASFHPPLSPEELQVKHAQEAFHACRFQDTEFYLGDLPEKAENRYIRITALYIACMLSILQENNSRFSHCYNSLREEFSRDFPYRKEMSSYLYELNTTILNGNDSPNSFRIEPGYPYHDSFLPHLAGLCAVSVSYADTSLMSADMLQPCEFLCSMLRNSTFYPELQNIHTYLGIRYGFLGKKEEMTYHIREALHLAQRYHLYYTPCSEYPFLNLLFDPALSAFPEEFQLRIRAESNYLHTCFAGFLRNIFGNSIYSQMSGNDLLFIRYAVCGYRNREIAQILHLAENTVSKRYSAIYEAMGVKNKKELLALYRKSLSETNLQNF